MNCCRIALLVILLAGAQACTVAPRSDVLFETTFENDDALEAFVFANPGGWRLTEAETDRALELVDGDDYTPPHRSPRRIALLADRQFGDVVMDVTLEQTGREYGHRDLCLFFGFRDPGHFYYVHLATKPDDHAHQVFIVNGAARTKISRMTSDGIAWGDGERHHVRLERRVRDGAIRVFFDDMTTPIMEAEDTTFLSGHVGFGSFDDVGRIYDVTLRGSAQTRQPTTFFTRHADAR